MHRIMRPLIWEQLSRTIPGVPMDPWELGALGSDTSLSPLWRASWCHHLAQHVMVGIDSDQTQTPSWLQCGQGEQHKSLALCAGKMLSLPAPVTFLLTGSSTARCGDTAPSAPIHDCWGRQQQCQTMRSVWLPPLTRPPAVTWGGGGRAALFPLCRELLYKGSSDIIH